MTDKEIVERAKEAERRTGFGELVHSPISKGVNSAFGIGFIEGMVEYRNSLQEEPVRKVWHYANEHPEIEKPILLRKENGVVELAICHDENFYPEIGEMWAYIDDILKL